MGDIRGKHPLFWLASAIEISALYDVTKAHKCSMNHSMNDRFQVSFSASILSKAVFESEEKTMSKTLYAGIDDLEVSRLLYT